ncbi:helix-turn-helix domain-containing protein [Comamonas sp. CMM01]|nr:helix-turn-helix domain-containing protein [Comamonas sp. CMM01]
MNRRNWKRVCPLNLVHALRLCKEFAQDRHQLSVERIADRMGVSHDTLYKWLATGRIPGILLPAFETVCGCSYASTWLAMSAGKFVIDMPKGKKISESDLVDFNTSFAEALSLLKDFYANGTGSEAAQQALQQHLAKAHWHHANVVKSATPELEFGDE